MVCRVCLKSTDLELEIFDENGVELCIPDILHLHLWFKPSPTDSISTTICLTCWCKLLEFHQFYETVKEAHKFYSEQLEITTGKNRALHEPVEIVEAVFNVKNEDTLEEAKWLGCTSSNLTSDEQIVEIKNDHINDAVRNPLYEPEVLEPLTIKTEHEREANKLEETLLTARNLRAKTQKAEDSIKNDNQNFSAVEDSGDDDYDDGESSGRQYIDSTDSHSEYEPEINEAKKTKTSKTTEANAGKCQARRGRPQGAKTKTHQTAKKSTTTTTTTKIKRKQEKRCWSSPKDDEMVRKHLTLNCEICCFHVENYADMIQHFQELHKNVRPYIVCCGRKISKRQRVVQHAYKHEDPNYFQCQICKKNFSDNYVLRSHILAHHPEEDELVYQCDQCEKRFSRRYLLDLHKPVHIPVDERKFMCNKCPTPKAFASDHLLKIHDSMRHKRAANVCHVCAKSIRDNQAFEKHVRLHFEESGPRVKCPRPGCDRWLKDEDNLKQHLRRHNDEGKIIKCEQCGKSVKNRRALSSHISYAHSTALFSCEECKKTFKKAITLKEHMAQHTGETLYKCPFCPRTFNSNANMHSHKKKMHPVQWDIWRKTKTGSSQSFQSQNNQFVEMTDSRRGEQNSHELTTQQQTKHDNLLYEADTANIPTSGVGIVL